MKARICELCNGEASLYCASDSAFLCWNCDARVHEANFLVARHLRRTICCKCKGFDENLISGVGLRRRQPTCRSCSSESDVDNTYDSDSDSDSSCTSSTCISISSAKNPSSDRRRPEKSSIFGEILSRKNRKIVKSGDSMNVDVKAEAILVNWCRKLGIKSSNTSVALHAFSICLRKFTNLPFRVSLASSLWLSLQLNKEILGSTCHKLEKLEEISGVPAKLVVLAEKKICRVLKINRKSEVDLEEGWAECSE